MDQRDDDIQFDFFEDEPATSETAQQRERLPRRGGNGGTAASRRSLGPPRGGAPLLRLLALVVFAIVVVLVFGLLIQSCASSSKHDSYASYMDDVQKIAAQSTANGKALATVLTTPGLSAQQIETKLRGIAEQERQNVRRRRSSTRPAACATRTGISSTLSACASAVSSASPTRSRRRRTSTTTWRDAALLAAQANRLLASDVVWDDLFRALVLVQLQNDGVNGVNVPDVELRREHGARHPEVDGARPAADSRRRHRRHARRHPRHEHRVGEGAAGRPDADGRPAEHRHRDRRRSRSTSPWRTRAKRRRWGSRSR